MVLNWHKKPTTLTLFRHKTIIKSFVMSSNANYRYIFWWLTQSSYLFSYIGVQYDFYVRWSSCRATVTRRVPLMEQELFTLPRAPEITHVFSGVRVVRSLVFCVMFCRSLCVLLSFFIWPLYWPLFFGLCLLITPLVSSNFSSFVY